MVNLNAGQYILAYILYTHYLYAKTGHNRSAGNDNVIFPYTWVLHCQFIFHYRIKQTLPLPLYFLSYFYSIFKLIYFFFINICISPLIIHCIQRQSVDNQHMVSQKNNMSCIWKNAPVSTSSMVSFNHHDLLRKISHPPPFSSPPRIPRLRVRVI